MKNSNFQLFYFTLQNLLRFYRKDVKILFTSSLNLKFKLNIFYNY